MARPHKSDIEKRDKIIELNLFTLDNPIYRIFDFDEDKSIQDLYAMQCATRLSSKVKAGLNYQVCKYESINFTDKEKEYNSNLEKLKEIDEYLYFYYSSLTSRVRGSKIRPKEYHVRTEVSASFLIEALGEKRFKEINFYGKIDGKVVDGLGNPIRDFKSRIDYLTNNDIEKIKEKALKHPQFFRTIIYKLIYRNVYGFGGEHRFKRNTFLLELDLTKSKKEILNYVERIKNNYDNKLGNIDNMYDLLNLGYETFQCNFKNCIIDENKNKTFNELLADILFVYDCKMAKFDNQTIIYEFERYYGHGIKATTIKKYYNIAIDHIDNKKYESFISGFQ